MSQRVAVRAPAKVNLYLRVLGRRDDGYHEIRTLFQAIELFDDVDVELGGEGIVLEVRGRGGERGPDLGPVERNLAYRAAEGYCGATGRDWGVRVRLTKRIPAGAGLGGGSSDAAAVLRCMAALYRDENGARLMALGATLGSDVPFFLCGSTLAAGSGRGEVVEPLPALPVADLVIAMPDVHVSTADAYAALGAEGWGGAEPGAEGVGVEAWRGVADWSDVASRARNDFQEVVAARYPEVRAALEALTQEGAEFALLSGSGGASFGLFADSGMAQGRAASLSARLVHPHLAVRTLAEPPEVTDGGVNAVP